MFCLHLILLQFDLNLANVMHNLFDCNRRICFYTLETLCRHMNRIKTKSEQIALCE